MIVPQFMVLPLAVLLGVVSRWRAACRWRLSQRIRLREPQRPVAAARGRDVPEEVAPLVGAINDLLARLDQSAGPRRNASWPTPRTS